MESGFVALANYERKSLGMPELPLAIVPYAMGGIPPDEARQLAVDAFGKMLGEISTALTGQQQGNAEPAKAKTVTVFNPTFMPEDPSFDGVNRLFYEKQWADGLPIVPPTVDRVAAMLRYTDLAPDHVLGKMGPSWHPTTVHHVAVNAVMAGCRPEYLPVLIAGIQAILDPELNCYGTQCTTNPAGIMLLVNGPIARELDINGGTNLFGQGWYANGTIGRAVRLCLINIGGGIPGETDKAILGMPGKYTFCLGEYEEESPWEPLHVSRGLKPEDSAVTVVSAQGTNNVVILSGNAEDALHLTADAMMTMGNNNVISGNGNPVVFFSPGHARLLVEQGFKTRRSVQEYLFEHARIPVEDFPKREILPSKPMSIRTVIDGKVCAIHEPDDLLVVVAGGPEPYHITYCASIGNSIAPTRKIRMN